MPGRILQFFFVLDKTKCYNLCCQRCGHFQAFFSPCCCAFSWENKVITQFTAQYPLSRQKNIIKDSFIQGPSYLGHLSLGFLRGKQKELFPLFSLIQWFMRLRVKPYFKDLNKQRCCHSEHFGCPYCVCHFSRRNHIQFFTVMILRVVIFILLLSKPILLSLFLVQGCDLRIDTHRSLTSLVETHRKLGGVKLLLIWPKACTKR